MLVNVIACEIREYNHARLSIWLVFLAVVHGRKLTAVLTIEISGLQLRS